MGDHFPKYKAAAVQIAPVWMDREASTEKVCRFAEEARNRGAELIVFSEVIIPGNPHWIWFQPTDFDHYVQLFKNSVEVPSETTRRLCETAAKIEAFLVVGVNERSGKALYNTMLFIDQQGNLVGTHRKLMGTYVEKTIWAMGGGEGLKVFDTKFGRLGGLICRENFSKLSCHVLATQGEQVHAGCWIAGSSRRGASFNKWIEASSIAHAVSSQTYVIAAQSCSSDQEIELFKLMGPGGWSAIISPKGEFIAGPLPEGEGIAVGDIDLEESIRSFPMWDEIGYHARPDVFKVLVNWEPYVDQPLPFPRFEMAQEGSKKGKLETK